MDILLTGSNGFLGGRITRLITTKTEYDVIAVASSEEKVMAMCEKEDIDYHRVHYISNTDFLKPETVLKDVYGAVHLAFSRRLRPASDIAASLVYAADVFHKLVDCRIDRVINISSQGIYGGTEDIRTEDTIPAPDNHYTMAKYASELLFNDILRDCPHHTNLRLDLIAQSQKIIQALCRSAKEGKIILKGGKQVFSFLDGEDAATAVLAMMCADGAWDDVYNVGWNCKRYTLVELAEIIADLAEKSGYKRPQIELNEADISLWAGMDSTRFIEKTKWVPTIEIDRTVKNILLNHN